MWSGDGALVRASAGVHVDAWTAPGALNGVELNGNGRYLPRVSVVIPALNEAKNLPFVLPKLPAYIDEVILVDGHSTDRTVEIARALVPQVRVVHQNGRGKGNALACGFAAASGDIIVMLDADGSAMHSSTARTWRRDRDSPRAADQRTSRGCAGSETG